MSDTGPLERLIAQIAAKFRLAAARTGEALLQPAVAAALRAVPREQFVPPALQAVAYDDTPLPIGHGQTISQPFIVALMTQLLRPTAEMVVLEVGTGSGYQAAVLAQLVAQVHTTEIVPSLAAEAGQRLARLGYHNITVHPLDGSQGLPQWAPFDAIIATAAPTQVPPPLVAQLRPGGRLVLPLGPQWGEQWLLLLEKGASGELQTAPLIPVAFVPMTGNPAPLWDAQHPLP